MTALLECPLALVRMLFTQFVMLCNGSPIGMWVCEEGTY